MGKSLKDLLLDKQAVAALAAQQAGNKVQPSNPQQNSTLLGSANTFVQNATGINTKELLVKYVGQEPIDKLRVEANFLEKFPEIAIKEYGLDAPRILLQRDPHANKKIIQKATGLVANVAGVIPLVGKVLKKGINKLADASLKPLYPDDWLTNPDSGNPTFEGYYHDIYTHKISNGHGIIGNYLQGNRTASQVKENLLSSGLSLGVSTALDLVQGFSKKFGGKTTKIGKTLGPDINNNREETNENKVWRPAFPSQYVIHSKTLDDNDVVMEFGFQQLRGDDFLNIGKKMWNRNTKSKMLDGETSSSKEFTLEKLYDKQFNTFFTGYAKKYFDNSKVIGDSNKPKNFYPTKGFTSQLGKRGEDDTDNVSGTYSKDVLRIYDAEKKKWSKRYSSIKELDNDSGGVYTGSLHLNYFTTDLSKNGGEGSIIDYGSYATGVLKNGSYYSEYTPINGIYQPGPGDIKPIRWNTSAVPYSKAFIQDGDITSGNEIYDQDWTFANNSKQSQKNTPDSENPYWSTFASVNEKNEEDRVRVTIGGVNVLGTITGLTDNTTPSWTDMKPVGSGFKFYVYDSWEREISFKFRMYAEADTDIKWIYKKANEIKSFTLPVAKGNLGVFGRIISLRIGNLLNIPYGFLTACNLTVLDESPWEITDGMQNPFIYDMDITYKVLTNNDGHQHYTPPGDNLVAYKTKVPRKLDLKGITPPNLGGPIPIEDIPVDPNANLTGDRNLTGFSPLAGDYSNPLQERFKEMDTNNFATPPISGMPNATSTTTPVGNTNTPQGPVWNKDELEALNAGRVPTQQTKGGTYPGGGTIMITNDYPGEKPKWWQFKERKKYWASQRIYLTGQ